MNENKYLEHPKALPIIQAKSPSPSSENPILE